jgi:hypothetical protein
VTEIPEPWLALAAEMDAMRAGTKELRGEVRLLTATVDALVAQTSPTGNGPLSWLDMGGTGRNTEAVLHTLWAWLNRVYLAYQPDAYLPVCWLWHDQVIEELLALMDTWVACHRPGASHREVSDWHDLRPRVAARVRGYTQGCGLPKHVDEAAPRVAPFPDSIYDMARSHAAPSYPRPIPTKDQLTLARNLVGGNRPS